MQNNLKEVTFKTLKKLKNQEIILPEDYANYFLQFAKELKIDVNDTNSILDGIHANEEKYNNIVKQTNSNLKLFSKSTNEAQIAIQNKDSSSLAKIETNILEMQEQINFLQNELFTDSLTKVKNRKWLFDSFLKNEVFTCTGQLAFIDLNNFKTINDTHGHIMGDQVLKFLADFLKKELKDINVSVVRYAGDEFIVINKQVLKEDFDSRMKQTQAKLSSLKLKSKKVSNLSFSFSYGISEFNDNDNFDEILKEADEKMYQNKVALKKSIKK